MGFTPFNKAPLLHGAFQQGAVFTRRRCCNHSGFHTFCLHSAVLQGAVLHSAVLQGALLHGAVLHGAVFTRRRFCNHDGFNTFQQGASLHNAFQQGDVFTRRHFCNHSGFHTFCLHGVHLSLLIVIRNVWNIRNSAIPAYMSVLNCVLLYFAVCVVF